MQWLWVLSPAATLTQAAPANASCASINGHSIGKGCESTACNIAIGIGRQATARAGGGTGNFALAIGNPGTNYFNEPDSPAWAQAGAGNNNRSIAIGRGMTTPTHYAG